MLYFQKKHVLSPPRNVLTIPETGTSRLGNFGKNIRKTCLKIFRIFLWIIFQRFFLTFPRLSVAAHSFSYEE